MFSYTLPCGGFKTVTTMTNEKITFDPPVYEQRYCYAIQILEDPRWTKQIKKVVEFGCAEMRLFNLMRRIETIEHILQVDIDEELLKNNLSRVNPLISDYIRQRSGPLRVEVLKGSVADSSEELRGTDVVIGLELIEHVYDDVLAKIPANVFGFMQPKIVIFSTPNSDFNVIFTRFNPLLENGFRHLDHKFEWTREEFKSWCLDIVEKYPNYLVSLTGVGDPPKDFESVGNVSQIAVFVRKDLLDKPLVDPLPSKTEPVDEFTTPYKSLQVVDFPYYTDTRTVEEKIWAEVEYELHRCMRSEDNFDIQHQVYKMPMDLLLQHTQSFGATPDILEKLLEENDMKVEDGYIILEENPYNEEDDLCFNNDTSEVSYEEVPQREDVEENWDLV
ncbi:small RNA 2'-O-methyltransferase [Scaptodrosophila lebanonensis]|uniref:Small RNA 2'-O-methyltransferase n=1 Tax=Drosophila lebanonensis TaxID=7225 RepID=A0A6J2TPM8_DROLE|nr:small RNA 2'-O-methyltransferase [Scaptodrosophila lebanonensis]